MSSLDHLSSPTSPLSTQVGGHAGVLTMEDGELLIKPALPHELEFYRNLQAEGGLATLRPYTPKFLGTLRLEGELDETKPQVDGIVLKPFSDKKDKRLLLENISYRFTRPNIMDIKLGTVLYDDEAPPDKVQRMIETARRTTSLETGIRLTGFQVYNNVTGLAVNTPKSYGKSIKPADLPDGMARFFPEGQKTIDPSGDGSSGLPGTLLRPILEGVIEDIKEIRGALAELELRMVGGSLLIVYEADWNKAEEGLKNVNEEEDEEDDEDDEEECGPPYVVKLIDFAHTKMVPRQGPDEGVLLGVDTVLRLLQGRMGQIV